jgi:hypothetical protein
MTKETFSVISFAMLVKASTPLIIKVDLPFASTWVHPRFSSGVRVAHRFRLFLLLSYYVPLRSEFRVVMSVALSAYKRCSVRLYLQLSIGGGAGLMSYLRYLWFFFVYLCFVYCVPNVASYSGLFIFDCPFGIFWRLFI